LVCDVRMHVYVEDDKNVTASAFENVIYFLC
jgi:hypothetical protein